MMQRNIPWWVSAGHPARALSRALPLVFATFTWGIALAQVDRARDLVDPFIGTGGHGHTFPGACVPNGLVQLSPDTRPDGINDWDGCSGYHYTDSIIYGFSHTHLSGTGVADLCDVLLMPMSNGWSLSPEDYRSPFDKASEKAHAGYYSVHLDKPDVTVELTSTARVGVHRYQFPKGSKAHLVLDLEHRDYVENSSIVILNDREVAGERRSSSWARDQRLFYCMRFSHPMQPRMPDNVVADQIAQYSSIKDHFDFGDLDGQPLIVKVGVSAVSMEGARANLDAEVPHWDFDQVRADAEASWNDKLGKISVSGGTREQQRIFYTALYHCYLAPYIFNDVDGHYRGMDGNVHHAEHPVYTVFSLWDTFRALHPLMTILEPGMTADQDLPAAL
jgi:predicted alpha-1,2-mannosidase